MNQINPEIEAIRTQVETYRRKSILKRLGASMLGKAPTSDDRETLRQHDLGPVGRTMENVFEAVGYSRRVDFTVSTPTLNAVSEAGFDMGDYPEMTLPAKLNRRHLEVAKKLFPASTDDHSSRPTDIDQMNSVAFFVGEYKASRSDQGQAAQTNVIGLIAMHDDDYVGNNVLSVSDMKAFDPTLMQGLEEISEVVRRNVDKQLTHETRENAN